MWPSFFCSKVRVLLLIYSQFIHVLFTREIQIIKEFSAQIWSLFPSLVNFIGEATWIGLLTRRREEVSFMSACGQHHAEIMCHPSIPLHSWRGRTFTLLVHVGPCISGLCLLLCVRASTRYSAFAFKTRRVESFFTFSPPSSFSGERGVRYKRKTADFPFLMAEWTSFWQNISFIHRQQDLHMHLEWAVVRIGDACGWSNTGCR